MTREEKANIMTAVLTQCKEEGYDEQLSIEALSQLNEEDLEYRDNVVIKKYLGEYELTGSTDYCDDDKHKTIDEVIELFQKLKEEGFTRVTPTYYYSDFNGLCIEKDGRETDDMVIERVFELVCKQYKKLSIAREEREQKQREIDRLMKKIDAIKESML